MTLKKCRKQLEQDMGLEPGGLDSHKDYVRDLIEKVQISVQWSAVYACVGCDTPSHYI